MTPGARSLASAPMRSLQRALIPILVCVGTLAACRTSEPHVVIGPETLTQIEAGTSRKFVVALLGEPAEKVLPENDFELWKWGYVQKKSSSGSVVFVIDSTPLGQSGPYAYVQFAAGKVVKAWRD